MTKPMVGININRESEKFIASALADLFGDYYSDGCIQDEMHLIAMHIS